MHEREEKSGRVACTVSEAAFRLAVSKSTIWRLLQTGQLGRVAIGRAVRVSLASVDALAARGGVPNVR